MTTEQTMLSHAGLGRILRSAACGLLLLSLAACQTGPKEIPLVQPAVSVAPYDTARGDVLWAVVPPRNESGTLTVDPLRVGDKLVAAVQEVRGLRCVPLNRTMEAMRALEMTSVATPAQIRHLAETLGVDGIIVGSITAYDPYDPPVLGLSLALHARGDAMSTPAPRVASTRDLVAQPSEFVLPNSSYDGAPTSVISEHLDARNHEVLVAVQHYAYGRDDPRLSLGWRRYTASMDLFTQFGAARAVDRLLESESARLSPNLPVAGVPE